MKHLLFDQVDSWFFRESRSMDGAGSTALNSLFPPPQNTLLGAIRTYIGDVFNAEHGTNWQEFKDNHALQNIIGFANDYANLKVQGAWLFNKATEEIYFPCPMNLLKQGEEETNFFQIGAPVYCDLGCVKLPQLDREKSQSPLEDMYISGRDYSAVLQGKTVPLNHLKARKAIITADERLGIARDNSRRKTEEGKLYQTNHLRLQQDWGLYLGLTGLAENVFKPHQLLRLGGEGRMTELSLLEKAPLLPQKVSKRENTKNLVIYLATNLPDHKRQKDTPMLPNESFKAVEENGITTWQGCILGKPIKIISAISAKPIRIGGWDMVKHKSLPVRSFIPAGSCWYIETEDAESIIETLHGEFLTQDNDRVLGYGQIFVGIAPTH